MELQLILRLMFSPQTLTSWCNAKGSKTAQRCKFRFPATLLSPSYSSKDQTRKQGGKPCSTDVFAALHLQSRRKSLARADVGPVVLLQQPAKKGESGLVTGVNTAGQTLWKLRVHFSALSLLFFACSCSHKRHRARKLL